MQGNSTTKFGGACALITGVMTLLAGILYLLLPADQRLGVPGAQLLPSFAGSPTVLSLENLALGLVGVFGLGIVPALGEQVAAGNSGWLRWTGNLAYVGYAVSAVGSFIFLGRLPGVASAYVAADPSTQAALAALWRTSLDPLGVWGYAAVGLWIVAVSLAAPRLKAWPQSLGYLGVLAGILHWLVPFAFIARLPVLFLVVAVVTGVAAAAWYIWVGRLLGRAA